ncbi:MAG: hypothetical protein AB7S48_01045 [Bacteroidales bacterium]
MRRLKLILDFIRFSIAVKLVFFRKVIADMTDNPLFPTPDVPLTTAKAIVDELEANQVAALNGGKAATATMRDTEIKADRIFRRLADYVDRVSEGDEAVILSSGFNLSKSYSPATRPEFSVTQNHIPGTVFLKRKAFAGAKSYLWQYYQGDTPTAEENWTLAGASTQAKFEVENLTPARMYWFRSAAVTKEGTTAYCTPVFKIVQ